VAPTFATLAVAQIALGFALAAVLSGAVAAAGEWPSARARSTVLSWALNGQPSAWVIGMPLIGVVAGVSWRLTWIVVPLASAVLALIAVRRLPSGEIPVRPRGAGGVTQVLRRGAVARWAVGELLAYSAWSGTLVFAGALFAESYGSSPALTGMLLGGAALAYIPGNVLARRTLDGTSTLPLGILALGASAGVAVFGVVRPSVEMSASVFALLALLSGARGFAGSIRGMVLAPDHKVAVMGLRAAATQFGYLLGSGLGGFALATGGYPGLAAMLSSLFALAALPHLVARGSSVPTAIGGEGSTRRARRPWSTR
jgi:predicted MFS family arabinose efflux permease